MRLLICVQLLPYFPLWCYLKIHMFKECNNKEKIDTISLLLMVILSPIINVMLQDMVVLGQHIAPQGLRAQYVEG